MNLVEINKRLNRIKNSVQSDLYKIEQLHDAIESELSKIEELRLEIATQISPDELPDDDPLSELRRLIDIEGTRDSVRELVESIKKKYSDQDHASFGKIMRDEDGNPI